MMKSCEVKLCPSPWLYFVPTISALTGVALRHTNLHPLLRHGAGLWYSLLIIPALELATSPRGFIPGMRVQVLLPPDAPKAEDPSLAKAKNFEDIPVYRAAVVTAMLSGLFALLHGILSVAAANGHLGFVPAAYAKHNLYDAVTFSLAAAAPQNLLQYVLSCTSVGYFLLVGIVGAHELLHKIDSKSKMERTLSWFYLSVCLNVSYFVEHHNHHKFIGTELDSAYSPKGTNVYSFIARMERVSWTRSFQTAREALQRYSSFIAFLRRDRFASGFALSVCILSTVFVILGPEATWCMIAMCAVGTLYLDVANYTEHYGLIRRRDRRTGELEPVGRYHSWDCSQTVSNVLLFSAGGHADHHIDGMTSYPSLDVGIGPEYPYGLHSIAWIALVPSLFFRVADPLVDRIEAERAAAEQVASAQ